MEFSPMLLLAWPAGSVCMIAALTFASGFKGGLGDEAEPFFLLIIVWPLALALLLIATPFIGLNYLGKATAKGIEKAKAAKAARLAAQKAAALPKPDDLTVVQLQQRYPQISEQTRG